MVEGKKMSRSNGNVLTMEDLERMGYHGREIRFFLLSAHYRKPLNFSLGALETAKNTLRKLNGFIQRLVRFTPGEGYPNTDQYVYDLKQGFHDAMDDDFNISGALAALFDFVKALSVPIAEGLLSSKDRDNVMTVIKKSIPFWAS